MAGQFDGLMVECYSRMTRSVLGLGVSRCCRAG